MKQVIQFYGHYDSRGGMTIVPASSRAGGDLVYSRIFSFMEDPGAELQAAHDDWEGEALVEMLTIPADGTELLHRYSGAGPDEIGIWWNQPEDSEPDDWFGPGVRYAISAGKPEGTWSQPDVMGEDAFGVMWDETGSC